MSELNAELHERMFAAAHRLSRIMVRVAEAIGRNEVLRPLSPSESDEIRGDRELLREWLGARHWLDRAEARLAKVREHVQALVEFFEEKGEPSPWLKN